VTPTDVLKKYLDAGAAYDFEAAWHLLCADRQQKEPLTEYLAKMSALPEGSVPEREYDDEDVSGDRATVRVTWMVADKEAFRAYSQELLALHDKGAITKQEYSVRLQRAWEHDLPRRPRSEIYELKLERSGWRVVGKQSGQN
jgi:hypothetical protein